MNPLSGIFVCSGKSRISESTGNRELRRLKMIGLQSSVLVSPCRSVSDPLHPCIQSSATHK